MVEKRVEAQIESMRRRDKNMNVYNRYRVEREEKISSRDQGIAFPTDTNGKKREAKKIFVNGILVFSTTEKENIQGFAGSILGQLSFPMHKKTSLTCFVVSDVMSILILKTFDEWLESWIAQTNT